MMLNPFKLRKLLEDTKWKLEVSNNLMEQLQEQNDLLDKKLVPIKPVNKAEVKGNQQYYIVTIASYQRVNGCKLLNGKADKPLQEAFNKGFIFDTEEKAKEVYQRIMAIKG
ncbi:Uncharacterised protein [Phocoenobacter uteri]|uniref:Uncharacterized protein n=1 Tax=Phocoenobacter uteri TaxID=146806 RepID=A0A379DEZ7_9PAST|nr:hypothetical protein [Phocoenobacter uteri]MDG6880985.1 hypothetical protein [Phocoenobacter uteri]SUB59003.1 Uncharacterised protein [Phocoenobacter uteri]SUB76459.1 Uncharacterised protein [Phocoenobacter uteri]